MHVSNFTVFFVVSILIFEKGVARLPFWVITALHSFIHSVVCPLPERVLHRVRSSASSSNLQHPLSSIRSSSSCLRFIPRLPVTFILSSIFPSITCSRGQFLRNIWPIQFAFLLFILRRKFLSSFTLRNTLISHTISPTDFLHFLQHQISNHPGISGVLSEVSKLQHHTKL